MNFLILLASCATLNWTMSDGRTVSENIELSKADHGETLSLSREKIRAMGAKRLDIVPDFARARKGEAGYWFTPYGVYGEYDRDNGSFFAGNERMPMPMFGWATPRGSYLAIIVSLPRFPRQTVRVKDGEYTIACTLEAELCRDPYEDLVIHYHCLAPGKRYPELAKIYRAYQLNRGAVKPLKERCRENKVLEQAINSLEIRIRQAWKPVPSPVLHQTPENEPPVKAMITFDRVKDIVREMKAQGIANAELCLVGWNIGGHDGRWPQYFPAEAKLGGTEKLKEAIKFARDAGYLIVPHGNFHDEYEIAENWSAEATIKDAHGFPRSTSAHSWGGGKPYYLCPQRAYEIHTSIMPRLGALGFKGLGYFDVVSICEPQVCRDPRHPVNPVTGAKFWGATAALSKRDLGGFASESGGDWFAGELDYSLYTYFGDPQKIADDYAARKGIAKRVVPIWQLVYNGIIAQNPFTTTMNVTLKDRATQLRAVEFAARPCFYFYAKFLSDGRNWMGEEDLGCQTEDELKTAVAAIKKGYDVYEQLKHLQFEFLENHQELARGVYRLDYSNGEHVIVDYGKGEWKLVRAGK